MHAQDQLGDNPTSQIYVKPCLDHGFFEKQMLLAYHLDPDWPVMYHFAATHHTMLIIVKQYAALVGSAHVLP